MTPSFWLVKLGRRQCHSLRLGALDEAETVESGAGDCDELETAERRTEGNVTEELRRTSLGLGPCNRREHSAGDPHSDLSVQQMIEASWELGGLAEPRV